MLSKCIMEPFDFEKFNKEVKFLNTYGRSWSCKLLYKTKCTSIFYSIFIFFNDNELNENNQNNSPLCVKWAVNNSTVSWDN